MTLLLLFFSVEPNVIPQAADDLVMPTEPIIIIMGAALVEWLLSL